MIAITRTEPSLPIAIAVDQEAFPPYLHVRCALPIGGFRLRSRKLNHPNRPGDTTLGRIRGEIHPDDNLSVAPLMQVTSLHQYPGVHESVYRTGSMLRLSDHCGFWVIVIVVWGVVETTVMV